MANNSGIPSVIQELMLIAPFNDLDTTSSIIEAHHDELAAVIVEPLQRVIAPQPGFLQGLRDITARHQIPLIFDEVVTGFRLAYGGAQEYYRGYAGPMQRWQNYGRRLSPGSGNWTR